MSLTRQLSSGDRGARIVRALLRSWLGVPRAIMNVSGGAAVDQKTEQLRAAVVTARVHQLLAFVDQCEVELGDHGPKLPSPVRLQADVDRLAIPDPTDKTDFVLEIVRRLKRELDGLRMKPAPEAIPQAVAVQDGGPPGTRHEGLKDAQVFLRGDHKRPGPTVPRGFPRILTGEKREPITTGSGRLQLADWLARPEHPLTARVMVNRIWLNHFGSGLVRTPNDFGLRGSALPLTVALQPGIGPDLALLRVRLRLVFADGVFAAINDCHVFAEKSHPGIVDCTTMRRVRPFFIA